MSTRVVIVEDEPLAIDRLRSCLAHHDDLELVGHAATGRSAVQLIDETDPDLMFLDVRMPELSGFEVLRRIRRNPAVIFTTAYDEYAVAAFEWGAFDYLLKPFGTERFSLAMRRFIERGAAPGMEGGLEERIHSVTGPEVLTRFFVRHAGRVVPVDTCEIVRIEADDDYSAVYAAGKRYSVYLPLREFARRLPPELFLRVHRSAIINLAEVAGIEQRERRVDIRMRDGSSVTASRAGAAALRALRI